jgi:diacylglycerol kinase (ATP)
MNLQEKWFAVVNPNSANGRTRNKWPVFYQKIVSAGLGVDYSYTSSHGNGIDLTKKALSQGYKKIIAVGGDGTVNEVINGLFINDRAAIEGIELAILGNGTGSDFIRTYKSSNNIDHFIDSLKDNRFFKSDVGKVIFQNKYGKKECRYFLNAANIGIGAEIVNHVNKRSKALGSKLTYFTGTIATIFRYSNISTSLILDNNKSIEGIYCGLVICNGRYIGGGMHIAPQAKVNDGFFDLVVIDDISKLRLLSQFSSIYKGRHISLPEINIYRCQTISLVTPEATILETDGEILGFSPSEFSILPQCLAIKI